MKYKYVWEREVPDTVCEPQQDQGLNIRSYDHSLVRICGLSFDVTLDKLFKSVNPSNLTHESCKYQTFLCLHEMAKDKFISIYKIILNTKK